MAQLEQECPVEGCDTKISLDHVMCRPHWYSVPRDLRDEVYAAWNARRRDRTDESMVRHIDAKKAAVAAAEMKEGSDADS